MPFCEECGQEIKEGNRFCEGCGREVKKAVAPPASKPAAPAIGSLLQVKKIMAAAVAAAVVISGYAAFGPEDTPGKPAAPALTAKKAVAAGPTINLESYNGNFFTIDKPAGWKVTTAGHGSTLAIWLRDPQEPARQAFTFGSVGPFYLSDQQKSIDHRYMSQAGYPIQWADMPVVSPATASSFLTKWNALTRTNIARQFAAELPVFSDLTIISVQPVPGPNGGQSELVRALFKINGKVAEGLFTTTVIETVPFMNGPGGHQGYALLFMGVTAPQHEFAHVQEKLIQSLASFNLSEQYVRSYMEASQAQFAGVMRAGQTLREASDIITKGWHARQKTYDILSVKRSDAMLGKERYRDEDGNVYEFPLGWYQNYDIHRNKYNKPQLQPIPDNDHAGWTAGALNGPKHVYVQ